MKLYLVTDENQEPIYVAAENMGAVENYYENGKLPTIEGIRLIDDQIIIIQ